MITPADYTDDLATAEEFLAHLRPSGAHWRTFVRGKLRWVFRGQRDASWRLLPSAWRTDCTTREEIRLLSNATYGVDTLGSMSCMLDCCSLTVPEAVADVHRQSNNELGMLQEFIVHSNYAGLPFPHSSVDIRVQDFGWAASFSEHIEDSYPGFEHRRSKIFDQVLQTQAIEIPEEVYREIPKEEHHHFRALERSWPSVANFTMRNSVAALAQHHGVPTRLLDWSHDSRKAAFFAGSGLGEDALGEDKKIAVFAVNPFMLRNHTLSESELGEGEDDREAAEVLLSSHSLFVEKTDTTSYLAAQEGLFTCPEYADLFRILTGEYPTIDLGLEKMATWRAKHSEAGDHAPNIRDYIRRVTLPYSEVDQLMELLDDERIMLTTLMPNLDRFKQCMLERSRRKQRIASRQAT
ncbi:FRG domain-containing protein [Haloferula sp. A504]|uniref:FRG domain-containing protein n=1 Tax=Haloferula sp. A504 TaxID=3373601 RepID=UPI0031C2902F|nr:FRG domain-containing protein [Verrucomicrobiaceae bacterium E54]